MTEEILPWYVVSNLLSSQSPLRCRKDLVVRSVDTLHAAHAAHAAFTSHNQG